MKTISTIKLAALFFISANIFFSGSCKKEETDKEPKEDSLKYLGSGQFAAWSPDGKKISFVSNDTLYTMNSDGSGKIGICTGGFTSAPTWSNSGEYFIYIDTLAQIYRVNKDGTGLKNLTNGAYTCMVPVWSPDDSQIAFITFGTQPDVYVMDNEGLNIQKLTNLGSCAPFQLPSWTSNGSSLLFTAGRNEESDLYFINVDGTGLRRLNFPDLSEVDAQLTSDDLTIYFGTMDYFSTERHIYKVNVDGTGLTDLTIGEGFHTTIALSPNESLIAFCETNHTSGPLYIMRTDGSDRKLLQDADVYYYSWSPDSKYICFEGGVNGRFGLWRIIVPG